MPWRASAATLLVGLLFPHHDARAACEPPSEIKFQPGFSTAEPRGGIARGMPDCLTFGARADQLTTVTAESPEQNVVFQIYQPPWTIVHTDYGYSVTGEALRGTEEGKDVSEWSGHLPVTGTYLIILNTTRGGGEYRLRIKIR